MTEIQETRKDIKKRQSPEKKLGIQFTVVSSNINSKIMKPRYNPTLLKFMKVRYQRGKLIMTIDTKIFMENSEGSYVPASRIVTEAEMLGHSR